MFAFSSFRRFHSSAALITVLPLLFMTVTGSVYRVLRNCFNVDKEHILWLLRLHSMELLKLEWIWPLMMCTLMLTMLASGFPLSPLYKRYTSQSHSANRPSLRLCLILQRSTLSSRNIHRVVTTWLFVFLGLTAVTGASWSIARFWFEVDKKQVEWLLFIHQGSYVSPSLYVSVLAVFFISVTMTGIRMLPLTQRLLKRWQQHCIHSSPLHYQRLSALDKSVNPSNTTQLQRSQQLEPIQLTQACTDQDGNIEIKSANSMNQLNAAGTPTT